MARPSQSKSRRASGSTRVLRAWEWLLWSGDLGHATEISTQIERDEETLAAGVLVCPSRSAGVSVRRASGRSQARDDSAGIDLEGKPIRHAKRVKVAIQREDRSQIQAFGCDDERSVSDIHRRVVVARHQRAHSLPLVGVRGVQG